MKRDSVWVGEITKNGQFPLVSGTERGYLCPFYGPVAPPPSCSSYFFNTDIVKIKFGGVYQKKKNKNKTSIDT